MSLTIKRRGKVEAERVRALGRGLRAQRGVHLTMPDPSRSGRQDAGRRRRSIRDRSGGHLSPREPRKP
jgi:hypothetical protein